MAGTAPERRECALTATSSDRKLVPLAMHSRTDKILLRSSVLSAPDAASMLDGRVSNHAPPSRDLWISTLVMVASGVPAAAQQNLDAVLRRAYEFGAAGNYPAALAEAQKLEAGVKGAIRNSPPQLRHRARNPGPRLPGAEQAR